MLLMTCMKIDNVLDDDVKDLKLSKEKDNFERDLFYMLTESYDLKRFLLCSPYSSDPILNYGGILSKKHEEAFVKHLYVEGRKNIEENIIHDICSGGKSTIKIVGNKGCGKTTLIHNLSRTLNKNGQRSLVLAE